MKADDIVIYESTVYPGASEEVCVPILEEISGLTLNETFFLGYSPERINPGDKIHRLTSIKKITSGSNSIAAKFVDDLYASIIPAGTHPVSSIKVAEAAKVIENTQRDLNIALINELCLIFHKIGIDTKEVLDAAGTKWNFLPFRPGLVGGHCIGVDPYYLTYKAESLGYRPEVILAGRRINDGMGSYIVDRLVKKMTQEKINVVDARVLIMGLSFKENCTDLRNTKVVDIIDTLNIYHVKVDIHDPWIDPDLAKTEYNISMLEQLAKTSMTLLFWLLPTRSFVNWALIRSGSLAKLTVLFLTSSTCFPEGKISTVSDQYNALLFYLAILLIRQNAADEFSAPRP